MRLGLLLSVGLLLPLVGSVWAQEVTVVTDGPALLRDTPAGRERMLVLGVSNPGETALEGLTLVAHCGEPELRRDLLPVRPGGAWDTLWLPVPTLDVVPAELRQGAAVLWSGALAVPPAGADAVLIPCSETVKLSDLKPLMLRGTNYLPRRYPWPGLWRQATEETFEGEFQVMNDLCMNSLRTFFFADEEAGLTRRDGAFTPPLLARICKLLEVADRHRLKVMICLGGSAPHLDELDYWRRFMRFSVEPFQYDGRILMWDLMNEPGGGDGPKATPALAHWLQTMYPELERVAPNHLLTVGLCWQFDQLFDLGIHPPVGQYHHYSGSIGYQPDGEPPVRNCADDMKATKGLLEGAPLTIGEFGYATQVDGARADASEDRQLEIYAGVLTGAEMARLAGVYNWTLFHFEPDWMGKGEQSFGVVNLDGSLKPAGQLLQLTYRRWRTMVKAPWEAP
jgi:hypothetical protein